MESETRYFQCVYISTEIHWHACAFREWIDLAFFSLFTDLYLDTEHLRFTLNTICNIYIYWLHRNRNVALIYMRLCLLCFAIRKIEMRIEVIKWPGNGFDIEKSPTFLIKIAVRHTHTQQIFAYKPKV